MASVKKPRKLIRLKKVYGPDGKLPVGKSTFYTDYVATGLVRLVPLGERAKAAVEDEIDDLVEQLITECDAKPQPMQSRLAKAREAARRARKERERKRRDPPEAA
jgi:hypothetical protein